MNESDLIPYAAMATLGTPPILVLAPHPDDEVLGCGGAILAHVEAGHPVDVIIVTDGSKGIPDPELSPSTARIIRANEAMAAARMLGYGQPEFWNYPDRGLLPDANLIDRIATLVMENNYQTAFIPSPLEIHPDHRNLALACLAVAERIDRRIDFCFYEVGQPLYPNRLLDISHHIATKRRAIACFSSQLSVQNYDLQNDGLNRFRRYTLPPTVTHAEGFFVVDSSQLCADANLMRLTGLPRLGRRDLDAGMADLCKRLTVMEHELTQLRQDLASMTQSRSWRITSPLRKIRIGWQAFGKLGLFLKR